MNKRRARVAAGMTLAAVRRVRSKLNAEREVDRMLTRARRGEERGSSALAQRVLITGSTRGIGLALATAFFERGASVVVHGRHEADARGVAQRLRRAQPSSSGRISGVGLDLTQTGAGTVVVEKAVAALGGIDLLVNNAGIHDPRLKPIWETSEVEMALALRINLLAAFEVSAAAVASMIHNDADGRIINISTMAAKPEGAYAGGIAAYGVSKIALEGLSLFLAAEVEEHGISVVTVRPDVIDTAMVAPFFTLDKRLRMLTTDSMVPPILYLATAPAEDVHGRIFDQLDLLAMLGDVDPSATTSPDT